MIGDAENPTPLVGLRRMAPDGVALYVKLEWMNPFGSVKDRAAKWMIDDMRLRGADRGPHRARADQRQHRHRARSDLRA